MPCEKEDKDRIASQNELLEREEPILEKMAEYDIALGKRKNKVCLRCLSNNKLGSAHCWMCGSAEDEYKDLWIYLSEEDNEEEQRRNESIMDLDEDI